MTEVRRVDDAGALYEEAAAVFVREAAAAIRREGAFSVALSGGATPRGMYELLAAEARLRDAVPWDKVAFFWSDERHVGPDHRDSNYRMAWDAMLSKLPVNADRVHRVKGEHPVADDVAEWYQAELQAAFGSTALPRFDLMILGIGADGHTASLFPDTRALTERHRLVVSNWVDALGMHRITMTLPLINAARQVLFLAAGDEKAEAVRAALEGAASGSPSVVPAGLVRPLDGETLWVLDRAAARLVPP